MSLRRPHRESWELVESKRVARSLSPTNTSRSERVIAGVHIEDYPERLALTPDLDKLESPRGRSRRRFNEHSLNDIEQPSTGNSPIEDVSEMVTNLEAPQPRKVHFDDDPITAMLSPVKPGIEVRPLQERVVPDFTPRLSDADKEREYLHSQDFPIQFLRPMPSLNQMMFQLTPAMGDPGTGFTKFGPQSPKKSLFIDPSEKTYDPDPNSQSFLKDRAITSYRPDRLTWDGKTGQQIPPSGKGYGIRLPTVAEMHQSRAASKKWQGRKYSVNPNMKSRHLAFDILKRKVNHHELLSLNLSADARRDALKIGGGELDVGGSAHIHPSTPSQPYPHSHTHSSSRSRERARHSSISTSTISSSKTSTFASRSKAPTQETLFAAPLCCNPACVHCSHQVPQLHASQIQSHDHKAEHNDMISVGGYDTRENRLRAQDFDRALDAGRYGIGGTMLWRIVRVTALVEDNGEAGEQYAWYAVPDRALGGFF